MALEFELVRVLRRRFVAQRVGVSPSTIDRMVKRGEFPEPLRLSRSAVGWRVEEVETWLAAREGARRTG